MQVTAAPFGAAAPPSRCSTPAVSRRHPGLAYRGPVHAAAERHRHRLPALAGDGVGGGADGHPELAAPGVDRSAGVIRTPVIDVQWSVATFTSQATIEVSSLPAPAAPAPQGCRPVRTAARERCRGAVVRRIPHPTAPFRRPPAAGQRQPRTRHLCRHPRLRQPRHHDQSRLPDLGSQPGHAVQRPGRRYPGGHRVGQTAGRRGHPHPLDRDAAARSRRRSSRCCSSTAITRGS